MNKKSLLSILSTLLIVGGILLILSPQITTWWVGRQSTNNAVMTEEVSAEALQENLERESEFDFDAINEISPTGVLLDGSSVDENLMIGRLVIPSIELNLTVYNGVTNDILNAGVGTMRPDLKMGEGNFPIAGHYAHNKNVLFGDLYSIEIGDAIYLTDNDKVYEYQVYDTRVVEPTEVEWIYDEVAEEHGSPIISLMNCFYVDGVNTDDRYFVFGELVDVQANT